MTRGNFINEVIENRFYFYKSNSWLNKALGNSGRKQKYKTGSMFCKDVHVFLTSDKMS